MHDKMPDGYYFSVSSRKFVVMSLCTLNLYLLYWFYKNWVQHRTHTGKKIRPAWRAFFSVLWAYSLFKIIKKTAEEYGIKSKGLWPAPMAIGYFLTNILTTHSDILTLVSLFSFVLVYPFNMAAIRINHAVSYGYVTQSSYSKKEIIIIAIGIILLFFFIAGMTSNP